jgi:capsular polysaccharide biosynthesis protein
MIEDEGVETRVVELQVSATAARSCDGIVLTPEERTKVLDIAIELAMPRMEAELIMSLQEAVEEVARNRVSHKSNQQREV